MKRIFDGVRYVKDLGKILWGIVRLVAKPTDISPIFNVGAFRRHKSMRLALESMRAHPGVAKLIRERYLSGPIDLAALAKLPPGTLGRAFADRMTAESLQVVFYPPMTDRENDDVNYLRKRARQTHDIWHVACGFPTESVGEMAISSFYLAQHRVPLSGLLLGVGFLTAVLRYPERIEELMNAIIYGWKLGKASDSLMAVKWEEMWDRPLAEIRAELGLCPDDHFFEKNRESSQNLKVAS